MFDQWTSTAAWPTLSALAALLTATLLAATLLTLKLIRALRCSGRS
jgi:hypothetical protein